MRESNDAEEALVDMDEDSDEVLNMPSLMMAHRVSARFLGSFSSLTNCLQRQSHGRPESIHSSRLPMSAVRAYNSRIYCQDLSQLLSIQTDLASSYDLHDDLSRMIKINSALAEKSISANWIIKRFWQTLSGLCDTVIASDSDARKPLIIGQRLPEKIMLEVIHILAQLGDTQSLGMVACVLELDRRGESVRFCVHCY